MPSVQDAVIAAGFATAAAASRLMLRHTLSRIQIIFFWFIAVAGEPLIASQIRGHVSYGGMVVDAAAAALAIITVKWSLEGLPWFITRLWR